MTPQPTCAEHGATTAEAHNELAARIAARQLEAKKETRAQELAPVR